MDLKDTAILCPALDNCSGVFKAGVREGLNAIAKKDPSFREFNQRVKVDQPFMWNNKMYLLPINDSEIYSNPQLVQSPEY